MFKLILPHTNGYAVWNPKSFFRHQAVNIRMRVIYWTDEVKMLI